VVLAASVPTGVAVAVVVVAMAAAAVREAAY